MESDLIENVPREVGNGKERGRKSGQVTWRAVLAQSHRKAPKTGQIQPHNCPSRGPGDILLLISQKL